MAVAEITPVVYLQPAAPSWVFARSTFTNDPETGARVAQYMRKPPVEPLDDQRAVTSRYRRTQTNIRGTQGSIETDYQVRAWGNGGGGIDAEWERFHDAWKESILSGGYYNSSPVGPYGRGREYGGPGYGYGGGYPQNGFGYGGPGYGSPPGYGGPAYGMPPGFGRQGPPHGGGQGHRQHGFKGFNEKHDD